MHLGRQHKDELHRHRRREEQAASALPQQVDGDARREGENHQHHTELSVGYAAEQRRARALQALHTGFAEDQLRSCKSLIYHEISFGRCPKPRQETKFPVPSIRFTNGESPIVRRAKSGSPEASGFRWGLG